MIYKKYKYETDERRYKNWLAVKKYRQTEHGKKVMKLDKEKQYVKNENERINLINKLGGKCKYCGCNIYKFINIHHINGGGYELIKKCKSNNPIYQIKRGLIKIEDLEILCNLCHNLYHLKLKNPKQAKRFKIVWI